jgi:hypothetical protein
MELELGNLWTRTGQPMSWQFEGADERELVGLLGTLSEFKADPASKTVVLIARSEDGAIVGAWSRDGAARLRDEMIAVPRQAPWIEIYGALDNAVTGP